MSLDYRSHYKCVGPGIEGQGDSAKIWNLGLRFLGVGLMVKAIEDLGFGVIEFRGLLGFGFKVEALGLRVEGLGVWVKVVGPSSWG